jgi:Zn-dependent protease
MKCEKCQNDTFLPFRCQYCGGYFCSEHRLPENHDCPRIELAKMSREETLPMTVQRQKSYEYTVTYAPQGIAKRKLWFSSKEITHLALAALLVIGVGLSLAGFQNLNSSMLPVFVTVFAASFLMHEMAHKIVAQRKGYWAEFRLTVMGAILTLLSILSPFFKIISPGAVMVSGYADTANMGRISIAGPTTNITFSTIFLVAAFLVPEDPSITMMLVVCAALNAWISLFNLIPFGVFDGYKVFLWNKAVWALSFAVSVVLTAVSYMLIYA